MAAGLHSYDTLVHVVHIRRLQQTPQQVLHQQVCAAVKLKTCRGQPRHVAAVNLYVAAGTFSFDILGYVIRLRRSTRRKEVGCG